MKTELERLLEEDGFRIVEPFNLCDWKDFYYLTKVSLTNDCEGCTGYEENCPMYHKGEDVEKFAPYLR